MFPRISLSSIIKLSAFLAAVYFADIKLPEKNIPPKNDLVLILNKAPIDTETISKKIKYIPALVVNRENKVRTVIKKDEIEGIKDIKNLADTSAYEEAWAYLPEKQEWHEIGFDEEIINYEPTIRNDVDYKKKLSRENNEIFIYHFHPTDESIEREGKEQEVVENEPEDKEEQYKESENYLGNIFEGYEDACPSMPDIISMIYSSINYTKLNPKVTIISKLGSIYGVTKYYLTEKGFEHYNQNNIDDVILKNPHALSTEDSIKVSSDFIEIIFRSYNYLETNAPKD